MTLRDLKLRLRALFARHRIERELDEELAFHIERETEDLVARGLSREEARVRARRRFGSAALIADQCRDERRTGVVDAAMRDAVYACRAFRRAPLWAFTIVATVGLGLGLVTVAFTLLNMLIFRVDAVRDPQELFGVERPRYPGAEDQIPFTRPQYEAMRRETSVFTDAAALLRGNNTRIDGRSMRATLVTGNFFQLAGVTATLGRPLTPGDDEPHAGRQVIVLSHRGWLRRFDGDPAVVGRTVRINGERFEIVGVMPEGFRGLSIGAPDYWAPLSLVGHFRRAYAGREDDVAVEVIGRLKPGANVESAAAALAVWASTGPRPTDSRPANIRLEPRKGTTGDDPGEVLLAFSPLLCAFGLILMTCCANVVNLQLARGIARQREIGTRLALGASRGRIVRQLVTESLLLALASAVLGFIISRAALAATIYTAVGALPPEVAERISLGVPAWDWRVVVFLLSGALVSTLFVGLAPALQTTRLDLVRTMRGEVGQDARPKRARNLLIGAQITASSLLLIPAAIFLRNAVDSSSFDPGIRTADTLSVEIANEPARAAVISALNADASVAGLAASRPGALGAPGNGVASASSRRVPVGYRFVSPEYFDVLNLPIMQGRGFTKSERTTESGVVVVSETAARNLWPEGSALNQVLSLEGPAKLPSRLFAVVGIVRDVSGSRFADWPRSGVYLPAALEDPGTKLTLRVRGNPDQVRLALFDRLTAIDPALDEIGTLRGQLQIEIYLLGLGFWIAVVLAGLALAFTLSGLYSVLSFVVEQRRKEIGVRMALGATMRDMRRLVVSQMLGLVAAGLITGTALAVALALVLLSTPLAPMNAAVHVFDPIAYGGSALAITTACLAAAWLPARRAAWIDPMVTLRQD